MHRHLLVLFLCGCTQMIINNTSARTGFGDTEQDWGYITVRPNAHMFWWLYYTSADVSNYTERPLIMWLQGGPGMPSSGYGNFGELGPLTPSLNEREDTVVKQFNILFVDNPIGTGYSYISDNDTKLTKNGDEIGKDLFYFLKGFLEVHPEFSNVPLYVFGESYGGKMVVDLAFHIVKENYTSCNLKGLGLGAAYIAPVEYVLQFAPIAYHIGLIDKQSFTRIDELAKQVEILISKKEMEAAADLSGIVDDEIHSEMDGSIDLYNLLTKMNESTPPSLYDFYEVLNKIMNGEVKKTLEIPDHIFWEYSSKKVQDALELDLLNSCTFKIEHLLNNTDMKIIVYNGILDFLVNTSGTLSWLGKLKWKGQEKWLNATKHPLEIDMTYQGYFRRAENLVFYAILRAGHSVPVDNMPAMNEILQRETLT